MALEMSPDRSLWSGPVDHRMRSLTLKVPPVGRRGEGRDVLKLPQVFLFTATSKRYEAHSMLLWLFLNMAGLPAVRRG